MRVSYFKVISLFMYQLFSLAVIDKCAIVNVSVCLCVRNIEILARSCKTKCAIVPEPTYKKERLAISCAVCDECDGAAQCDLFDLKILPLTLLNIIPSITLVLLHALFPPVHLNQFHFQMLQKICHHWEKDVIFCILPSNVVANCMHERNAFACMTVHIAQWGWSVFW